MTGEELGYTGVDRRALLKAAGVGAAIAWATPAVTTLSSGAFAQPGGTERCEVEACGRDCTTFAERCSEPFCYCDTDTEGVCHCLNYSAFCRQYQRDCRSSADCPEGHWCIPGTCCMRTICAPACDEPIIGPASPSHDTSNLRPAG